MSADQVDNSIKKDASTFGDDVKKGWEELKEGASEAHQNLDKENQKIHDTFSGDFDRKANQQGGKLHEAEQKLDKENQKIHDTFSGDFDKKAHQEGEKLKDANQKWTHGVDEKVNEFDNSAKDEFGKVKNGTKRENEKIRDTFDSKPTHGTTGQTAGTTAGQTHNASTAPGTGTPTCQNHGTWDNFKEGAAHANRDLDAANKRFTSAVDESSEHFGKAVNSAWDSLKSGVNGLINGGEKK